MAGKGKTKTQNQNTSRAAIGVKQDPLQTRDGLKMAAGLSETLRTDARDDKQQQNSL